MELFSGAGGLALGFGLAGFDHEAVVEWDRWACDTIRQNQLENYSLVKDWNVIEGDVREIDWSSIKGPIDLVSGGPPCQPFSLGGKHGADEDRRDMFPAATDVIRQLAPSAFVLENVKGLTRARFANYFQYVQLSLSLPEITQRKNETWHEHFVRIQREHTSGKHSTLTYRVVANVINAADYGVPQQRHRVFVIGFRSDVEAEWSFPEPTHSREALRVAQEDGSYWSRHHIPKSRRPDLMGSPRPLDADVQLLPWRTVRDALIGLPSPTLRPRREVLNHVLQPGARSYVGHTGSPLDLPAKTLKAGDHGVPGGENMLRNGDGSVRYFTVREAARLQTFPDSYELHGTWTEAMRQLGNAVPVLLAQQVAGSVYEHLEFAKLRAKRGRRKTRGAVA